MSTRYSVENVNFSRVGSPWRYVGAGFVALMVGVNVMPVLFNVFAGAFSAEFGWTRAELSTALAIFTAVDGLSMLAVGALVDRWGIKSTAWMAVAFGGGLMAMSFVPPQLVWLYALCAIMGLGAGVVSPTIYSIVINAWFEGRRGLALGIVNVGLGLCGTLMPFVLSLLSERFGWRSAVQMVGALAMILPFINVAFLLRMPQHWEQERKAALSRGKFAGDSLLDLAKTKHLWLVSSSILFVSAGTYGLLSQVVPIVVDKGMTRAVALTALSTISLSSVVSRMMVGALLDRLFAPFVAAFIFVLTGAGVLLITYMDAGWEVYVAAALIGVGLGAEADVAAYVLSRYVPKASYGRAFGLVMFLYAQGGGLGVLVLGRAYAMLGSYTLALYLIVGLVSLSAISIVILGPYKYGVDKSERC
ncbi:MFS transporter [Burkholderia sp. WSM2230]|uniref:MFS transporter n=1 Tax=Burkholderia sp. WSM2230 TaxID=944435 RepID=UPI000401F2FC|nr:MFS transporter [Burkholderia sp. WSM2230]